MKTRRLRRFERYTPKRGRLRKALIYTGTAVAVGLTTFFAWKGLNKATAKKIEHNIKKAIELNSQIKEKPYSALHEMAGLDSTQVKKITSLSKRTGFSIGKILSVLMYPDPVEPYIIDSYVTQVNTLKRYLQKERDPKKAFELKQKIKSKECAIEVLRTALEMDPGAFEKIRSIIANKKTEFDVLDFLPDSLSQAK